MGWFRPTHSLLSHPDCKRLLLNSGDLICVGVDQGAIRLDERPVSRVLLLSQYDGRIELSSLPMFFPTLFPPGDGFVTSNRIRVWRFVL